jgi:hypothetical protein
MRYTEEQVLGMLARQCKDAGGQKYWAELHNMSKSYLCDVLNGRRDIGEKILEALGLQRVCLYETQKRQ